MLSYKFDWAIVTSGKYFDWIVSGFYVTIKLSTVSIALSFLVGLIIAIMRMSHLRPVRWFAHGYLEFFRNTPLLVQIFFWYFGSYKVLPAVANDWLVKQDFEFAAAVIALTIYTSAFIAEDIRSGVRSIPKEQMEAARSSGFSYIRSMQYIILPQAVRLTIPPLINQYLNLAKNSSLAFGIGYLDLYAVSQIIFNQSGQAVQVIALLMATYLALSLSISFLMNWVNRRMEIPGR